MSIYCERYRDLMCLACLVLDDGTIDGRELAERAHRAVWESVPGRLAERSGDEQKVYEVLRRRLLTRLLRDEPRAGRVRRSFWRLTRPRMPRWVGLSVVLPETSSMLAGRTPEDRALVALGAIDGLTVAQARGVITDALDGRDRPVRAADGDDAVPGVSELLTALGGFDASSLLSEPGRASRQRRRRRSVLVVAVIAVIVAGYAVGTTVWNDSPHAGDPTVIGLAAWRRETVARGLRDWPAEGNLTGDWPLLRAAASAYRAGERLDPASSVYVLYAGDLAGAGTLVVLGADRGVENSVDAYHPDASVPLTRLGSYPDGDDDAPYLIPLPGDRLLVPPWRTSLSMAWLNGAGVPLDWRTLPVRDGIATEVANDVRAPACIATVAVVRYRDASFGTRYAFTGSVLVAPSGPFGASAWPAEVVFNGSAENVPSGTFGPLAGLTCEDGASADWLRDGGYELDITQYGQANLPGAGLVRAVSLYAQDATFRVAELAQGTALDGGQAEFVDAGGTLASGVSSPGPGLTAAWWKSPAGKWFLLAAGGSDLSAFGPRGALRAVLRSGTFTVFSTGGSPGTAGPVVVTDSEDAVTVLPSDARSG